jgi:hypothetical protein
MYTLFSQNVTIDFSELPQYSTFLTWGLVGGGIILLIVLAYWANNRGFGPDYQSTSDTRKKNKTSNIIASVTILAYIAFSLVALSFNNSVSQQREEAVQDIIQSELGTALNPEQLTYVLSVQTKSRFGRISVPIGLELPSGEQKSYSLLYTGEGDKYELSELSEK